MTRIRKALNGNFKMALVIMGALGTLVLVLSGVVYEELDKKVEQKASQIYVDQRFNDLKELINQRFDDQEKLFKEHMKHD